MTDRFDDLGRPRSAAERFEELDERQPEPMEEPPRPTQPRGRYTWVVGIVFLILIIVVGVNSIPNAGEGLRGPEPGTRLPVFAAPSATGALEGDANVKQSAGDESGNDTPACDVRGRDVVSVCDERGRRPVVVAFVATGSRDCRDQLDAIEQVRREFPGTAFFGVLLRAGQPDARDVVRDHGWGFPVAIDRDLAVFNLYRLAVCSTVFANARGTVVHTELGTLSAGELRRRLRGL